MLIKPIVQPIFWSARCLESIYVLSPPSALRLRDVTTSIRTRSRREGTGSDVEEPRSDWLFMYALPSLVLASMPPFPWRFKNKGSPRLVYTLCAQAIGSGRDDDRRSVGGELN